MANRVAEVNKALRLAGQAERLVRGNGYYYFTGGTASGWPAAAVYVYRAAELTVEQWLNEHRELKAEWERRQ